MAEQKRTPATGRPEPKPEWEAKADAAHEAILARPVGAQRSAA